MDQHCNTCETEQFCTDMNRCMYMVLKNKFDDGEVDNSVQELTADDFAGQKKIIVSSKAGKLSSAEIDILKLAIK